MYIWGVKGCFAMCKDPFSLRLLGFQVVNIGQEQKLIYCQNLNLIHIFDSELSRQLWDWINIHSFEKSQQAKVGIKTQILTFLFHIVTRESTICTILI